MEDSNIHDNIDGNPGMFIKPDDTRGFVNDQGSHNFFFRFMNYALLFGAEKALMARKSPRPLAFSNTDSSNGRAQNEMHFEEKECGNSHRLLFHSRSNNGIEWNDMYAQFSEAIDYPSNFFSEFHLDHFGALLRMFTVLALNLAGFQINLLARFFSLPIELFNIWITFLAFPFHALAFARQHLKTKLLTLWSNSCFSLIYFVCDRIKIQKSVLKLAVRLCWAFFWSIYVCLILVGLLVLGFVIGCIAMRHLVVEPIQTTETLNFDYTKPSPVSFVPIASSPVAGVSPGLQNSNGRTPFSMHHPGDRPIAYNHKLRLTVSLTMPESEYNRKLGIFQVRVECLSLEGKVIASSSYPTMLEFKSQPIRFVETIFKSILLLTGFQSEVQNLKIGAIDFTEGIEPTGCFKVIIEQRAEYDPGFGIPEIYAASIHIESDLPRSKRIMWNWRRTIFVWISIFSFLIELVTVLMCFKPIILPAGRTILKGIGDKGRYGMNKIHGEHDDQNLRA